MTIKFAIDNIKSKNWYRQGGALVPFFLTLPYLCVHKEIGYHNVFIVQKRDWNMGHFNRDVEKEFAEKYLKEYLSNPEFLAKRIKKWSASVKKQQDLLKQIMALSLDENTKLKNLIQKFSRRTIDTWHITMVIEVFDPWGEYFIKQYASKYNLSNDEIGVLTSPEKYTYLQEELIDRYKIAKSKDLSRIEQHYNNYYWYLTSWQHAPSTNLKYFEKLIKNNVNNLDELEKQVKDIQKHHDSIKKKKKDLIKKHEIDDKTKRFFKFFSELNEWRDIRKREGVAKVNYHLWILLKKISKYNKVSMKKTMHTCINELESFKYSKEYIKTLDKRSKEDYTYYFDEDNNLTWTYGKDAEKIFNTLENKIKAQSKDIKGRPAYQGHASGKVKIINSIKEFSKMKQGDVLVSIMTRPEMLPVMRRASAIVTDEGGLTCHAAIVSRELKIPCIVGTQIASAVLKDGDLVEVDANKGIVRKLE